MAVSEHTLKRSVARMRDMRIASAPMPRIVQFPTAKPTSEPLRWKAIIDRPLATTLLVPGIVLIGALWALVRLTSRGPGLFRQTRVGRNGRIFTLYKIRTMVQDAEAKTGAVWCKTNDARVTRLGALLRKLHLDELPQLFNVLKGEMSLVGPRPERPEFVAVLVEAIPDYRRRLDIEPGITGLAQLNLPPDSDLDSVRRKLVLDIEYIECASPLLDLRLLAVTFLRLIRVPNAWARKLLGVHRTVVLPEGDESREEQVAEGSQRRAA